MEDSSLRKSPQTDRKSQSLSRPNPNKSILKKRGVSTALNTIPGTNMNTPKESKFSKKLSFGADILVREVDFKDEKNEFEHEYRQPF